jgi:UDP-glucuronate 4-epimerase
MTWLVTGAAGFIGYHVAETLLNRGEEVLGIDNLGDYYSTDLKRARLARLTNQKAFSFAECDIAEIDSLVAAARAYPVRRIVHLAAQAGVRYSLENPQAYVRANVLGHVNVLELARQYDGLEHLCYASSSSIYGGRTDLPFRETDPADRPVSLYAATKRADELISHTYAHLYRMPLTGLRFFTVYGPWGRPDMAYWTFTRDILAGKPIEVFNAGEMLRDFTYVDDVVDGILKIATIGQIGVRDVPHAIYNIGNNSPENLNDFIAILERTIGRKANRIDRGMQPGDVPATYADIEAIQRDYGFVPKTALEAGLSRFVGWFRQYHNL